MAKRGSGRDEIFWLWTGETEFEGHVLSVSEGSLTARVRPCDRWTQANGAPGTPVPLDVMERQRRLARRMGFGQSPAILSGALLEFRIETVQPSREAGYDYVLAGTFARVADEHLETLSELSLDGALRYLLSTSRASSPGKVRIG